MKLSINVIYYVNRFCIQQLQAMLCKCIKLFACYTHAYTNTYTTGAMHTYARSRALTHTHTHTRSHACTHSHTL